MRRILPTRRSGAASTTPRRADYTLTLPRAGELTKLLDTDWQCFGGRTEKPKRLVGKACEGELKLTLAPFSGQLFKLV